MKKICFNKGWSFTFEKDLDAFNTFGHLKYADASNASSRFYDHSNWTPVDLPHDWAITLPRSIWGDMTHGAYPSSHWHHKRTEGRTDEPMDVREIGWYRKQFFLDASYANKRIFIDFEGVFRDSIVWVNGVYIDRHASGYTGFTYEITDHLLIGEENSIAIRVNTEQHEGWWYEGAGIYRNVWLCVAEPIYFPLYQTVVKAKIDGTVEATAKIFNDTEQPVCDTAHWSVKDPLGNMVAEAEASFSVDAYSETAVTVELKVENPLLWHVDTPNLYTLSVNAGDETSEVFGFRSFSFDADRGFFLNGKPLKLYGACNHHDFGGVGTALNDNLNFYKVSMLKKMGINAVRSSHNPQSPAFLRACDELGMLVMEETRAFGTSPEALRQMKSMVERSRNHPSIFLWSIGNEEFSVQSLDWSYRLGKKMMRYIRELDDTRLFTYGGSNGSDYTGVNSAVDVRGINYVQNGVRKTDPNGYWVETYHKNHPHQPILGSEESSYVLGRGELQDDIGSGILDCAGDITMHWGSTPKGWVKYYERYPFLAGGFIWTGFDYRGEPNPYTHANHTSSFGTIDLCGIPKPPFYYYRAWFTNEPVLKLTPHWNYDEGDLAKIVLYTNCECVTVTLNGKEIGTYHPEKLDDVRLEIPFEAGVLRAEGVRNGIRYTDELKTAGKAASVCCETVLQGTEEDDISIVELRAVDENGNFCPLATDTVSLTLPTGNIVGVGNGDPADFGYEQKPTEEEIRYIRTFSNEGGGLYEIPPKVGNSQSRTHFHFPSYQSNLEGFEEDYRIVVYSEALQDVPVEKVFTTRIRGIKQYEYLEFERFGADVTVYVNGKEVGNNKRSARDTSVRYTRPYRFYCDFSEEVNEIRVVATLAHEKVVPISGYVKVGRIKKTPWQVRLHYGLARVFLKTTAPQELNAQLVKEN